MFHNQCGTLVIPSTEAIDFLYDLELPAGQGFLLYSYLVLEEALQLESEKFGIH